MINNPILFMQQFNQFRNSFNGNAQQQVQQLLNSGKITQDQYNNAIKMASEFKKYIK